MANIEPATNRLGFETSPYLLQHQKNPVHWLPWSDDAFDRARREGKPVLLSVGYAACHWCHVMARECFEDSEIAALMNALFVNIKLDREERPDLDQIYQAALGILGQPGGWPLTLFLTPERVPFWGGTYFPPVSRYGRPGFRDVLVRVAHAYRQQPQAVALAASQIHEALSRLGEGEGEGEGAVSMALINRVAERLLHEVDPIWGGLGSAPKFPHVPAFELLWRAWKRTGQEPYRQAVITTLTRMSQGGIYDHLAGGFARYATDDEWLVPHFEKMLYDNALLIGLLTWVWQETGISLYATRVEETVGWVLREMTTADGGFASSIDADSEHQEGKFAVWTAAEIDANLGDMAALFKDHYGVDPLGNWEGVCILNRAEAITLESPEIEARLAVARACLLAIRDQRPRPEKDDKILADWNGLMIEALARAGMLFKRPEWIMAAQRAFRFIQDTMTVKGRLHHHWRLGRLGASGLLDDYATMSGAALTLFEATDDSAYLDQTRRWMTIVDRHFWDSDKGGYFFTADDAEVTLVRTKSASDGATPNGNALMLGVLARLHHLTGDVAYRQRADALIRAFSGQFGRNALGCAALLNRIETLDSPTVVVIIGKAGADDTDVLRRAAMTSAGPDSVLVMVAPDTQLPITHPGYGKVMVGGVATAYLCAKNRCGPPEVEPEALIRSLTGSA